MEAAQHAFHGAWAVLFAPFAEYAFMRRALVATMALSLSAAPLGVLLTLRRMSLLGDALSHAILPGVAIGFMLCGLSLTAMAAGGVLAGMLVAALAGFISRATTLKEDASLAAVYLVALALGVTLISGHGTQLDLLHICSAARWGLTRRACCWWPAWPASAWSRWRQPTAAWCLRVLTRCSSTQQAAAPLSNGYGSRAF
jgi:zinc/manganese transport system permease protein